MADDVSTARPRLLGAVHLADSRLLQIGRWIVETIELRGHDPVDESCRGQTPFMTRLKVAEIACSVWISSSLNEASRRRESAPGR
jgi:hypothetical protein